MTTRDAEHLDDPWARGVDDDEMAESRARYDDEAYDRMADDDFGA